MLTLLSNATTNVRITCPMPADKNFALKIAAKPLEIVTWLLLTAYRDSLSCYLMVPSPTPYDLPFSRKTNTIDDK